MWKGLALHTWTLDTTPWTRCCASRAPLAGTPSNCGVWTSSGLRSGANRPAVLDLVDRAALPVACVGVELGWMFAEGAERRRLLEAFDESCRWATALGCATVMSPVDRGRVPWTERPQRARGWRHRGAARGSPGPGVQLAGRRSSTRWRRCGRYFGEAAHPHCGVLLDTYHFGRSGGNPGNSDALSPDEIVYIQYSDVPRSGLEPGKAVDRLPPGQGAVPFRAIFRRRPVAGTRLPLLRGAQPRSVGPRPGIAARKALEATRIALSGVTPAS